MHEGWAGKRFQCSFQNEIFENHQNPGSVASCYMGQMCLFPILKGTQNTLPHTCSHNAVFPFSAKYTPQVCCKEKETKNAIK